MKRKDLLSAGIIMAALGLGTAIYLIAVRAPEGQGLTFAISTLLLAIGIFQLLGWWRANFR